MAHDMDSLRVGALCAGYGGLELGIGQVLDVETVWYSEIDHYASRVLAHHHPGVENVGDVKGARLWEVESVDMVTAGYPCQPFSHAGQRRGAEDPRHLWPSIFTYVAAHLPRFVAFENVRGHVINGLLQVLRDLTSVGYTVHYYVFPASAVGACHRRERVFIFGAHGVPPVRRDVPVLTFRDGRYVDGRGVAAKAPPRRSGVAYGDVITEGLPAIEDGNGHGKSLAIEVQHLLPTPVSDNSRGLPQTGTDYQSLPNVAIAFAKAQQLLPTPTVSDHKASGSYGYGGQSFNTLTDATVRQPERWGDYAAAVASGELVNGPAPAPTAPAPKGGHRLSPAFVEWMMTLPAGHVTDPAIWEGATNARGALLKGERGAGTIRNAQLKLLGNGVVPLQAAAATRAWIRDAGLLPRAGLGE